MVESNYCPDCCSEVIKKDANKYYCSKCEENFSHDMVIAEDFYKRSMYASNTN